MRSRAHRLTPRVRSALIVVDGQRSDEELHRLIPSQAAETLRWLAANGFIEAFGPPPEAAQWPVAPPAPAAAPAAPPPRPPAGFEARRRELVRSLNDLLGPGAETLAIKMERAADAEALRPLIVMARKIVAYARGQQAAREFFERFSDL